MGLNAIGILGAYGFREKWARNFTDFRIRVIPDNDISGEIFAESIEKAFRLINKEIQIMRLEININDFTDYRISRGK